jgi:hypothetical protein
VSTDLAPMVSTVPDAVSTETTHVPIDSLRTAIKFGRWKTQIEEIRQRYRETLKKTGERNAAKLAVNSLKKKLPGILWSGTFTRRDKDSIERHSGLLCIDIDNLNSAKDEVRQKLSTSPYLYFLHESPTGEGLKATFSVSPDQSKHTGSFRAIQQHVRELTGAEVDTAASDLARISFASWDPFAYYNPKAKQIEPLPEPEKPPRPRGTIVDLSERQRIAEELLGAIDWQSETSGILVCPGKHLHTAANGERDCKIELDGVPTLHCFHNHCRGILDGINKELRSRIGKAEFHAKPDDEPITGAHVIRDPSVGDLSDISAKSELTTGLKSPKSLWSPPYGDHPAPLSPDAYHGLTGAFVQCVLPETEADPAALLIQFAAAFGNAINRRAHAIADGSCHALNIFATIVGPTSKSRKRTSWTHVYRVFEHADEEWANRVTGGLSSGEGLIWNVRDPILKTVNGETRVVDEGVIDKRLFVCEEEFASVLKVMGREGNTLSTVLRSAWDSGKLSTLVKNNPARATGAHISVVAHVTREELRRLLTETESANGFGNRFLWLLVKRSKTLPEGGLIPAIADIVEGLQKALEFARATEEITRTESARKLWAEVYPALSEGKPGLVGALIARSEAQVLRLSCIYALLDCSRAVDVPHLRAALEVWRYCEDSARLIFESGTGNKDADRILQALKIAGETGLTKTQLVHDVFSRHATRFEIDEALRLLHGLDLAHCKQENTAGRPLERWFTAKP